MAVGTDAFGFPSGPRRANPDSSRRQELGLCFCAGKIEQKDRVIEALRDFPEVFSLS